MKAAGTAQVGATFDGSHIPALDGLRGVAILLVMVQHLWCTPPSTFADRAAGTVACLGWFGVDLFFVLSGFLITGILLDSRNRPRYFVDFYARRILRIFPLYYAILALSLFVLPHVLPADKAARFGTIAGDEVYYWLYLSNFAIARVGQPRHGVLDVTWSLAVEEQFYLVWPLIIRCIPGRRLLHMLVAMCVASLVTRIALVAFSHYNGFSIYVATPCRLDGLAAGAALAVAARTQGGLLALRRVARITVWTLLPLAIAAPIVEEVLVSESAGVGLNPVFIIGGFPVLAALFAALLVLVVTAEQHSRLGAVFNSTFLRTFGKYSYGLYLMHLPIRALIRDRLFGPSTKHARFTFPTFRGSELPGQLLFYGLAGAAALVVAWASFHLFERRFLALKRHFSSPARQPAEAVLRRATLD